VFGVNDQDSAKLVSDLAGEETVVFETMSRAIDAEESGLSFGQQHVGRALLTPMKSAHCARPPAPVSRRAAPDHRRQAALLCRSRVRRAVRSGMIDRAVAGLQTNGSI
jgi:hypothetical protein